MKIVAAREHLPEHEQDSYYWIRVWCRNCHYEEAVAILKGNRVREASCPFCGVDDLEKIR